MSQQRTYKTTWTDQVGDIAPPEAVPGHHWTPPTPTNAPNGRHLRMICAVARQRRNAAA